MLYTSVRTVYKIKAYVLNQTKTHTCIKYYYANNKNNNSVALVRERTTPTERPPLVGEFSANVC
jgi:hypothetical protein